MGGAALNRRAATLAAALAFAGVATRPARAEFPIAVQLTAGAGVGAAKAEGLGTGPFAGMAAIDLDWRSRPGHALVLSFEGGATGCPCSHVPERRVIDSAGHGALLLGVEHSDPGTGMRPYMQGGIGVGQARAGIGSDERVRYGLAVGWGGGFRIIPPPGPLGFVLGVRTSHVFAAGMRTHLAAFTLGLTLHPR
jgi:hypothetical protein